MLRVFVLLFAAGCAKPPPAPVNLGPPPPVGLLCPPGTIPVGSSPPHGFHAWCEEHAVTGVVSKRGPDLIWHSNGQVAEEGSNLDSKREGQWSTYYPDGKLKSQGAYALGKQAGTWTFFDTTGAQSSQGEMVDDKEHGPWIYWNNATGARTEGVWIFGDRDGIWSDFDGEGKPIRKRTYRGGRLVMTEEL